MIDKKIKLLGDKFRGLWQVRELIIRSKSNVTRYSPQTDYKIKWYVTFKYNGDFLETEAQDTIEAALDYAIDFLGL
ncbi:hypothetical protein LCGC14_1717350 [marine sediment metagenome]|uniref:Uncharacterized protein n=1 Tax=marine sediment metagenome TaxID=412755 RepID=A0A0F9HD69_9ZZZZ